MTSILINEHGRFSTVLRRVSTGDFTIGIYRLERSKAPAYPHLHPRASLSLILEGEATSRFSNHESVLHIGSIDVEPAVLPHTHTFRSRELVWCTLEIDHERARSVDELHAFLCKPCSSANEATVRMFRRMVQELEHSDGSQAITLEGLALELLGTLIRRERSIPRSKGPDWLPAAVQLVESRTAQRCRLSDLAREVGVHPVHLAREFRRHTGLPVGEFVRRRRVDHAAQMLRETEYCASFIAQHCGFSDQSHLTRLFVRQNGQTPGQYRAKHHARS